MSEQTDRLVPAIENRGATTIELLAWTVFGIGIAMWIVASFVLAAESTTFDPDIAGPTAWITLGQWIAGVTIVPAILLTGIRALLPDRRIG